MSLFDPDVASLFNLLIEERKERLALEERLKLVEIEDRTALRRSARTGRDRHAGVQRRIRIRSLQAGQPQTYPDHGEMQ